MRFEGACQRDLTQGVKFVYSSLIAVPTGEETSAAKES